MNRKDLKLAGKNLFNKNYWHSVLVALLMLLGQTGGFGFSFSTNKGSSENGMDALFSAPTQPVFSESKFLIIFFLGLLSTLLLLCLVLTPLRTGGIRYFLKSRKNQPVQLTELVQNFNDKTFLNIAKITFCKNIFILLWMMLFLVPGIIKVFEYWAIDYILAVRPDIDRKEAHRLSKILMDGNKWDCFVLGLSFIGWNLLSAFTFGLLHLFYVNPYMQASYVEFFSDLRLQALAKGTITPNDIPDYEVYNPFYQTPYDQPQNNFYAPQQPVYQPTEQQIAQPTEPVVDSPIEEPVVEETEPTTEENNE